MWAYDFPFVVAAAMIAGRQHHRPPPDHRALHEIAVPEGTVSGWLPGDGGLLFTDRDARTISEITTWCPDAADDRQRDGLRRPGRRGRRPEVPRRTPARRAAVRHGSGPRQRGLPRLPVRRGGGGPDPGLRRDGGARTSRTPASSSLAAYATWAAAQPGRRSSSPPSSASPSAAWSRCLTELLAYRWVRDNPAAAPAVALGLLLSCRTPRCACYGGEGKALDTPYDEPSAQRRRGSPCRG